MDAGNQKGRFSGEIADFRAQVATADLMIKEAVFSLRKLEDKRDDFKREIRELRKEQALCRARIKALVKRSAEPKPYREILAETRRSASVAMRKQGMTFVAIAKVLGLSAAVVNQYCKRAERDEWREADRIEGLAEDAETPE